MKTHFERHNIPWDLAERMALYKKMELYKIIETEEAGFLVLREDTERIFIADLQIRNKYQNRGIGTQAITEAKKIAKNRGYKQIYLRIFKDNPARSLYRRNGFKQEAEEQYVYLLSSNI